MEVQGSTVVMGIGAACGALSGMFDFMPGGTVIGAAVGVFAGWSVGKVIFDKYTMKEAAIVVGSGALGYLLGGALGMGAGTLAGKYLASRKVKSVPTTSSLSQMGPNPRLGPAQQAASTLNQTTAPEAASATATTRSLPTPGVSQLYPGAALRDMQAGNPSTGQN